MGEWVGGRLERARAPAHRLVHREDAPQLMRSGDEAMRSGDDTRSGDGTWLRSPSESKNGFVSSSSYRGALSRSCSSSRACLISHVELVIKMNRYDLAMPQMSKPTRPSAPHAIYLRGIAALAPSPPPRAAATSVAAASVATSASPRPSPTVTVAGSMADSIAGSMQLERREENKLLMRQICCGSGCTAFKWGVYPTRTCALN